MVVDIDSALTTSDAQFSTQLSDWDDDPLQREAASAMLQAYAAKGYWIIYVTGRPNIDKVRELTNSWLAAHQFPQTQDRTEVFLAPDLLSAIMPRPYKASVIKGLQAQGFTSD